MTPHLAQHAQEHMAVVGMLPCPADDYITDCNPVVSVAERVQNGWLGVQQSNLPHEAPGFVQIYDERVMLQLFSAVGRTGLIALAHHWRLSIWEKVANPLALALLGTTVDMGRKRVHGNVAP